MNKSEILAKTELFVQNFLKGESTGHDWWHIDRVRNLSLIIAQKENADKFIVQMSALLHDVSDRKLHNNDEEAGLKILVDWLSSLDLDSKSKDHILEIIKSISFKGAGVTSNMKTLEGKIVQDADRLDAIGAIGIARAFAFGGNRKRQIHNPNIKPELHESYEQYKNSNGTTINHFYEKLLLLKDRMNTDTGKSLAIERHKFMENYLAQFYAEWNAEK